MKALPYIVILMLLVFNSCASTLYTGAEYDDLYYSGSDRAAVRQEAVVSGPVAEKELKANDYYDNIYAGDTLVADTYANPSDYDDQVDMSNSYAGNGSGYEYYDDSYSNRINMFYGNYFNPYWQDPFYFGSGFGFGSPYFGFGYGYRPYYGMGFGYGFDYGYGYYPYSWDPYFSYGGYWGYPSYGYWGYPYYGGYYGNYWGNHHHGENNYVSYGRRERPSTTSSKWNENMGMGGSRRGDISGGTYASGNRRSGSSSIQPEQTASARRSNSGLNQGGVARSSQEAVRGEGSARSSISTQNSQRPEYRNSNRTYTPSYNNPRLSTRPSYNNSRVSDGAGSSMNRNNSYNNFNNSGSGRNSQRVFNQGSVNSGNSGSGTNRYSAPSGRSSSSGSYSMPSRRSESSGSGRSYSSGSSGSSYSGSRSSSGGGSSYSGGSSSRSSGGSSYSGGGSSGSSSSHSSGSSRR